MNNIPPFKEGFVTIQLHHKDLDALVALLNETTKTYNSITQNAREINDSASVDMYSIRAKLSSMFCEILSEQTIIEEPKSRESH